MGIINNFIQTKSLLLENCLLSPFFMVFFQLYKIIFIYFLCFPIYNNVYPKRCQSYKKDVCQ